VLKLTEEALNESKEEYKTLFDESRDAILITTRDGTCINANQAALDLFGYTREEMRRLNARQLYVDTVDARRFQKEIERRGFVRDYEVKLRKKNGTEMDCLFTVSVRASNGTILGYQGIIRDITERKRAEVELQQSIKKLRKSLESTATSLALAVEMKDPYTAGHQERVKKLACAIAQEMGLSNDQVEGVRITSSLHDIGKIGVPAEILSKPGRLSDIEHNLIKNHPQTGYELLKDIEFPWPVAQIVLQHHERMDGSGYPQGLKGEEILLEARVLAVADLVEAMASHRPYRAALGIEAALEEISKNKGILYDSEVVDACIKLFTEKRFTFE
jgi:PAS domain S-box-containing protein/putative nucleotidyltransferase with HDIG domain